MTARAARRWLWLASLVAAPVPVLVLGPGRVPPLYLAELAGVALAIVLVESARGVVLPVSALLFGQAALWAAALWLAAWLAARALARLGPRGLRRATGLLLAAGLGLACALPIYETPFAARTARASLLRVYP
jgi:hypothetical protein